jgi:hypothetical protein
LAAGLHGLYDFCLDNGIVLVPTVIVLAASVLWHVYTERLLGNSDFYTQEVNLDPSVLKNYLFTAFLGVWTWEYLMVSIRFGPLYATEHLIDNGERLLYITAMLISGLGLISINPKKTVGKPQNGAPA